MSLTSNSDSKKIVFCALLLYFTDYVCNDNLIYRRERWCSGRTFKSSHTLRKVSSIVSSKD